MKVNKSRKSTHAIMAHGGSFGELSICRDNIRIVVPKHYMFNDGRLKKKYINVIDKAFKKFNNNNDVQVIVNISQLSQASGKALNLITGDVKYAE